MLRFVTRKFVVILVIALAIAYLFFVLFNYINSFTNIKVTIQNTQSLVFYKSLPEKNDQPYTEIYKNVKPVKTIEKTGKYKIKKGTYRYFTKPTNQDYQAESKKIIITKDTPEIAINLAYTNEKLGNLYQAELPNILLALNTKYPTQMQKYSVNYGKLYDYGNWFGGYLVPKDGSDLLQAVLHKKDNTWQVAATPNITISTAQYPDIPKTVADGVNVTPN
jgi:hypothetical protein